MYSYEERMRAVKLYMHLGKRVGATIHQLGYPTENSLKNWHLEYERCLDLPRGYLRSKARYSQAQKQQAVGHYLDHGRCIAATINALGYPGRDSLRAWIHELHPALRVRIVNRSAGLARSPAMKQAAVIALRVRQQSAAAVAQKIGVCRPTLYNWKNQLLGSEAPASMKHSVESPASPKRQELELQLESLQREIYRLQL